MKFYSTILLFSAFLVPTYKGFCSRPFSFTLTAHSGFMINHSPKGGENSGFSLGNVQGLEAQIEWLQIGNRNWHKTYRYPKWGISILIFDLGAKKFGGYLVNAIAHQSIRMINTKGFKAHFRLGTGLGYTAFPYDENENSKNMWLSAPISPIMHGQLELEKTISSSFSALFTGAYTHLSNGNLRRPNLGINIPSISLGIRYLFENDSKSIKKDSICTYPTHKNMWHIQASFGAKTLPEFGTDYYAVGAISLQFGRRVSGVTKFLTGIDFNRDYSIFQRSDYQGEDINRLGMFIAHEWVFGRLSIYAGPGLYLYKKSDFDPWNYIKVGLREHISKHVYLSCVLKTHYGQADYFEWSIGYTY